MLIAFQEFKIIIENEIGIKIQTLRSHNGGEHNSIKLTIFATKRA
jgi:hypothetical protein